MGGREEERREEMWTSPENGTHKQTHTYTHQGLEITEEMSVPPSGDMKALHTLRKLKSCTLLERISAVYIVGNLVS